MQVKDIKRLLDVLGETDVRELTLETGEYKLTVRRGLEPAPVTSFQNAPVPPLGALQQAAQGQGAPSTPVTAGAGAAGHDANSAAGGSQA
ncbi:MAG TPA: hypothetical protein VFD39_14855, partial [Trueperaceae bacterium]|nr:hypothetical protein [Trueperaceae bacterium]